MKILKTQSFADQNITWVAPGDDVPYCQGAALNRLNKEYPAKNKMCGYMMYTNHPMSDPDSQELETALYYMIERKTKLSTGETRNCLILFKENGVSVSGHAIMPLPEVN